MKIMKGRRNGKLYISRMEMEKKEALRAAYKKARLHVRIPTQTSEAFAEGEERLERGSGFDACDKACNAREVAT